MSTYEIWHNPRCSKSRQALGLLEDNGIHPLIRRYLDDAPGMDDIRAALTALGMSPIDIMRTGESRFRELGLGKDTDPDILIRAMADNPILIERPIVIHGDQAVMGRPPEAVLSLLKS